MRPDRPYIIQDPVPAGHASMAWGTGASVVLHGFLAILLLFVAHATRLPAVPDDSVPVELINLPPPEPPVPAAPARPAAPAMVTASHLFSDTALADPADRAARREFARLTGDERLQQLCNLEALSQLKAWNAALKPDRLVAYAMAEATLAGNMLTADGAAFHNDAGWRRLRYRCGLTPDHLKVASFQFAVGDPIPRNQWQSHNLPTPDGADPD